MSPRGVVFVVVALVAGWVPPAMAASRVEVSQGRVSATFEEAPASEALDEVRRATGVDIVVPPSVLSKQLTLTVQNLSFEQFVRRLLEVLDLGGFALVYEPSGAAGRLIVVDRARGAPPEAPAGAPGAEPASAAAPGAPVYIPPRQPPEYIPPREPPVYIPPASPPVYIPPTSPPEYVPPAAEPQPPPTAP